ncbi:MAG TPA: glycosyl hydrolase family 28-related protein [Microvirga sp.]|nr:glycosyl hydrolase family 28-related protein [Microvirga sp.]
MSLTTPGRMPRRFARGTSAEVAAYTGPLGELVVNTETRRIHLQDGVTPGGMAMLRTDEAPDPKAALTFASRADAIASNIPPIAMNIRSVGYTSPGDGGGAYYKRLDAVPVPAKPWHFQSADEAWWELAETVVSVKMFGAKGNAAGDDLAAIQAAVDFVGARGGGSVFFPNGYYRITGAITIADANVVLIGESRHSTVLQQATPTAGILNMTGLYCGVKGLAFIYLGTPDALAEAIHSTGSFCMFSDFVIRSAGIGMALSNCSGVKVTEFEVFDYETAGVTAESLNDLFLSKFIMNAGTEARGTLGGLRLVNQVEALIATDGDILSGQWSMTTHVDSYGPGARPAYNNFVNVYFDGSMNGVLIDGLVETPFTGCWFSGGRSGSMPGCRIGRADGIKFTNSRFFSNGTTGATVTADAKRVSFIGCSFNGNCVSAPGGIALEFEPNTTNFQVIGCTLTNGLGLGTQGYGIKIHAGCAEFRLRDNDVAGNTVLGILDESSDAADKIISGNIGYVTTNSGQATIGAGAQQVQVSHGLAAAPRSQDIVLTRAGSNQGSEDLYVHSITATTFIIQTAPAPSSGLSINWQARIKGA